MLDLQYDPETGIATWRTTEILKDTYDRRTAPWHLQVMAKVTCEVERLRVLDGKHAKATLEIEVKDMSPELPGTTQLLP